MIKMHGYTSRLIFISQIVSINRGTNVILAAVVPLILTKNFIYKSRSLQMERESCKHFILAD